jgi:prevent-host-death family protein
VTQTTGDVLSISEARAQLAAVVDRARTEHRPVFLSRRGRRVAAVIDADDLDRLLDLAADMADIRAAESARAEMRETGATPIPWEAVKADLGL